MQVTRYSRYLKSLFISADLVILLVFFYFFLGDSFGADIAARQRVGWFMLVVGLGWLLVSQYSRLYHVPRTLTYTLHIERIIRHLVLFILLVLGLNELSTDVNLRYNALIFVGALTVVVLVFKSFTYFALKYYRALGKNHRNVMFLFEDDLSTILKQTLQRRKDYGYKIFEYQASPQSVEALIDFWEKNGIDTLFLPSEKSAQEVEHIAAICAAAEENGVSLSFVPNVLNKHFSQYHLQYFEAFPVLVPIRYPLDFLSNRCLKRIFDTLFSLSFLVLVGVWLFPLIALLIWWDSGRPIFFVQERYGYQNRVFKCIKFRTMQAHPDEPSAKKITKIGHFLRKTSLDETPQFINVLLGQMSVVGPRPHMLSVDDFYKSKIERYNIRAYVKPGVTGLSQVSGLRGDGKEVDIRMQKRLLKDIFYIKNWSIGMDVIIIFKTVLLMIKGDENAI
ncbi:exopolysaccharide biosynthesis polyprenyl glycosylphosphotransferase [Riemerella columbina]|uniref:exopolysaccharide biosynthesis polyprenyl glycosylphosphotransferase n=1 Tax=Riemerella columbina TaxID=103810 RepID=UPI00266ECA60|nr:exopolysaccharide biosynthesis polyprenyl glycosylphosphotransferase [Riemerella columbina]WKS95048.1 exopolysaccharide biosynthesis polyprenyl glycosylphosphotransferase [Riemerella columbina]